jgi:glycosyltransferase involved in cell wall biosynthesis
MSKKIFIISHYAGSIINFRGPFISELIKWKSTVMVFAPDLTEDFKRDIQRLGAVAASFSLDRTGLNFFKDILTTIELFKKFRKLSPDVVFTYSAKTNVWGILAATFASVPHRVAMVEGMGYVFTHSHSYAKLKNRILRVLLSALYRITFKMAHKVIVLNPDDAKELQDRCGLSQNKIVLLGGIGVPLKDWPWHPPHFKPLTFTLIARLLREKGVMEFLQAAQQIKAHRPEVRFCILGGLDDNPGALNKTDIQPWLDAGIVEWPGQVDVKPWLAKTSVYVLPSYREGVPRSTQEAMAMGRPIITTDVPGCRETLVQGINGLLVPPRDVPALTHAMMQFVEHPEWLAPMGQASRRIAEEKFDVRVINQKLMDVLGVPEA